MGKDRGYAFETPTLAQLAKQAPWFTAHCNRPCCHSAPLPWRAVLTRISPNATVHDLRPRLRCLVCGRRASGGITIPADTYVSTGATKIIPWADVPTWARELPTWTSASRPKN